MAILTADDMIRVENHQDTDIILRFNSKPYRIKAGKTGFIPFALAKHTWGDPRTQMAKIRLQIDQNNVEFLEPRSKELSRLAIKYGLHENPGDLTEMKARMPNATCYTIDGDELIFPPDDPNCQMVMGLRDSDDDREALMDEISSMRRRLLMLEGYAETMLPDGVVDAVTPDEPAQRPPAVRVESPEPFPSNNVSIADIDADDDWEDPNAEVDDHVLAGVGAAMGSMGSGLSGRVQEDRPQRAPILRPRAPVPVRSVDA